VEAVLEQERAKRESLALPAELNQRIAEKAKELGTSLDTTAAVLLGYGLGVQEQRERELEDLAERIASSNDPAEIDRLQNQLGEFLFGK